MKKLLICLVTCSAFGQATVYRASNYGSWTSYVASTGTSSLVANPVVVNSQFIPFLPNGVVTLDKNLATAETLTVVPTNCYAGSLTCTLSGIFTYTHIAGSVISSGTFGLQEAINQAELSPSSGTVLIDNTWQGPAGSSLITSAIGSVNVVIQDNRSGSPVFYQWNGSAYVATSVIGSVQPEAYGAIGNGGTYFDGVMSATQLYAFSTATSSTATAPAITTQTADDVVISAYSTNATWSAIPGVTNTRVNGTYTAGQYGVFMGDQTVATAGSVAAVTGTLSASTVNIGLSLPLQPVANKSIAFVNATSTIGPTSQVLTISTPTYSAGDTMVACVAFYSPGSVYIMKLPNGWTPVASTVDSAHDVMHCMTHVATSSEPASYAWTNTTANGMSGWIADYTNVAGIDGGAYILTSASAPFTPSSVGNPICIVDFNGLTLPAAQACGTITGYNSASSVVTSLDATSALTNLQYATGHDDTSAFDTMLTSCAPNGCKVVLGAKRYVLTGSLTLPASVPITIEGTGAGVNNTANSFLNSNTHPNTNSGTALMWLTRGLSSAAISITGTSGVTSTTVQDTLHNFSVIAGTGYNRDGGGSDGIDVLNFQGVTIQSVFVFGFSGRGEYIDAINSGSPKDYIENINNIGVYLSYNGGVGFQIGSSNANNLEAISFESGIIEANGGPGVYIGGGGIEGFRFVSNTVQWDNVFGANPEIQTSTGINGASFSGNYIEWDSNLGSLSNAPFSSNYLSWAAAQQCPANNFGNSGLCGNYTSPSFFGSGPMVTYFDDYFSAAFIAGGSIGSPSGNSCTASVQEVSASHPGTIRLDSGNASSGGESCVEGTQANIVSPNSTAGWTWESSVFPEVLPGTTAGAIQVGLVTTQSVSPWTNGIGFYLSSANATVNDWYYQYGTTYTDCGIAATAAWTRLTIVNNGASVHFYVNGKQCGSGVAIASVPSSSMFMAWTSTTLTASTHIYLDVDYLSFQRAVTR